MELIHDLLLKLSCDAINTFLICHIKKRKKKRRRRRVSLSRSIINLIGETEGVYVSAFERPKVAEQAVTMEKDVNGG